MDLHRRVRNALLVWRPRAFALVLISDLGPPATIDRLELRCCAFCALKRHFPICLRCVLYAVDRMNVVV